MLLVKPGLLIDYENGAAPFKLTWPPFCGASSTTNFETWALAPLRTERAGLAVGDRELTRRQDRWVRSAAEKEALRLPRGLDTGMASRSFFARSFHIVHSQTSSSTGSGAGQGPQVSGAN